MSQKRSKGDPPSYLMEIVYTIRITVKGAQGDEPLDRVIVADATIYGRSLRQHRYGLLAEGLDIEAAVTGTVWPRFRDQLLADGNVLTEDLVRLDTGPGDVWWAQVQSNFNKLPVVDGRFVPEGEVVAQDTSQGTIDGNTRIAAAEAAEEG